MSVNAKEDLICLTKSELQEMWNMFTEVFPEGKREFRLKRDSPMWKWHLNWGGSAKRKREAVA